MNAKDRSRLAVAVAQLEEALEIIGDLAEAEQEKFDNMTESLQQGERGQAIEQAAMTLDDAKNELESVINSLGELG